MKQTESEKLVELSNRFYRREQLARVKKNEPYMRFVRGHGVIFAGSSGLDYSGIKKGGQHISFEVKETRIDKLPMQKIRTSQIDRMESESKLDADVFLLIYFSSLEEWYRLEWDALDQLMDFDATSIPIRYFRAFGFMIPNPRGFPEYLSPESYPEKNLLKKDLHDWIPTKSRRRKVEPLPKVNWLDPKIRQARIKKAMRRGERNAIRREEQAEMWKIK